MDASHMEDFCPDDRPALPMSSESIHGVLESDSNQSGKALAHQPSQDPSETTESSSLYPILESRIYSKAQPGRAIEDLKQPIECLKVPQIPTITELQRRLEGIAPPSGPPDTLVFLDYPKTTEFQGLSSFPLHIHSESLLATGSNVFQKLLAPTSQFRTLRRRRLANHLPTGVKYILDLTPPDEGDEAVDLIADLSLSMGIRQWYTMERNCRIDKRVVCGSDESADTDLLPTSLLSPVKFNHQLPRIGLTPRSTLEEEADLKAAIQLSEVEYMSKAVGVLEAIPPSSTASEVSNHFQEPVPVWKDLMTPKTVDEASSDFQTAIKLSQTFNEVEYQNSTTTGINSSTVMLHENRGVPEYSSVRHILGIRRLLMLVEGRRPDLDSAPKVWTLFTLAKYFDCTSLVIDYISGWIMERYSNSLFVEVLPEMTAKIGLGLQSPNLARAAFSVLVGEEVLSSVHRRSNPLEPDPSLTVFGRRREDIDDDLRNRIEYASKALEERVSKTFDHLFSKDVPWLEELPEFAKILKFQQAIDQVQDWHRLQWTQHLQFLRNLITSSVRRVILFALAAPLANMAVAKRTFRDHRDFDAMCFPDVDGKRTAEHIYRAYDGLGRRDRIFTRPFWDILSNRLLRHSENWIIMRETQAFAAQENLDLVLPAELDKAAANANDDVLEAVLNGYLNAETLQPQTVAKTVPSTTIRSYKEAMVYVDMDKVLRFWRLQAQIAKYDEPDRPNESLECALEDLARENNLSESGRRTLKSIKMAGTPWHISSKNREWMQFFRNGGSVPNRSTSDDWFVNQWWDSQNIVARTGSPPMDGGPAYEYLDPRPTASASSKAQVAREKCPDEDSPFLDMSRLMLQVDSHFKKVANEMLNTDNLGFAPQAVDVLVSLTDNEFKYLPVFAGGEDDGTGVVFTDPVPEGINGLVPIGPGPFFKTGLSAIGSSASSYSESIADTETVDSETIGSMDEGNSAMVEDGFSGVFPRTRVMHNSDIASVAWSDEGVTWKGKGTEKTRETEPIFTPGTSVVSAATVAEGDAVGVLVGHHSGGMGGDDGDSVVDISMEEESVGDKDYSHDNIKCLDDNNEGAVGTTSDTADSDPDNDPDHMDEEEEWDADFEDEDEGDFFLY